MASSGHFPNIIYTFEMHLAIKCYIQNCGILMKVAVQLPLLKDKLSLSAVSFDTSEISCPKPDD